MAKAKESFSSAEARRIALAAQLFSARKVQSVSAAHVRRVVDALGAVQIDSVNVLVRSHFLPVYSRLGSYDRALLHNIKYGKTRRLFEYWAHEASLLPVELYPLLRWRMERAKRGEGTWSHVARTGREQGALVERVRKTIAERGPMSASDFEEPRTGESWWGWNDAKRAVEFLFWSGVLTARTRRSSFERVYDLTERVLPADVLEQAVPNEADAQRELTMRAARAFGIATEADLRDYFRLDTADSQARVAELVEAGALIPVSVRGWKQHAYLHPEAAMPRKIETSALLSPFDSLVWNRARTHRLFDFHYRIEIYTPAHKRIHGYYVLPYLLDDRLVARVDLKSERSLDTLRVHSVHYEPGVDRKGVAARLRADLAKLAEWLELERVVPRIS
ncbi:MAG: YcaQ family DNA glycosylase [Candidatus Eremiobacteraeota bacterium]|nr:YcaQ family DNA glycosylase [Candidatus Eremiobacteraeota bacterium]